MIGMRDPRSAVGMPMMTVGPRSIPLDQPRKYIQRVLGETIGDMAERSADDVVPQVIPDIMKSQGPQAAGVRGWMNPKYADEAREAFKSSHEIYDDQAGFENLTKYDDDLVNWLAKMFYGSK